VKLNQQVAIVTGAGSGIGAGIAKLFAAEGARLVIAEIDETRAAETQAAIEQSGGQALAIKTDVSNRDSVQAMAAQVLNRYGHIDILVNNAAVLTRGDLLATDEAMWDLTMNVTLKGTFLCSKAVLPTMIAQKRGVIINISSGNALVAVGSMAYSAAKAGVLNLTKNMAVEYGQHNIRINAICPGAVRTPIWQPKLEVEPQIFERIAQRVPPGRVGEPEDIAKAALFLASDDAAWITGDIMAVDGGATAGRHSRELDPQPPAQQ